MSFFFSHFLASLKCRLRRPAFVIFLAALPLITLFLSYAMSFENSGSSVTAAVVYEGNIEDCVHGKAFISLLEKKNNENISFICVDEDMARRGVLIGEYDSAVILSDDFDARVEEGRLDGIFAVVESELSLVSPLVREVAAAAFMEVYSPYIARDCLYHFGIATEETVGEYEDMIYSTLAPQDRVNIEKETLGGEKITVTHAKKQIAEELITGVLIAAMAVLFFLSVKELAQYMSSPSAKRLYSVASPLSIGLSNLLASFIPALISVFIAYLVI